MNKREQASIVRKIEEHKKALAKQRDQLRDFLDELECLDGSLEEAIDSLDRAADALSQYV